MIDEDQQKYEDRDQFTASYQSPVCQVNAQVKLIRRKANLELPPMNGRTIIIFYVIPQRYRISVRPKNLVHLMVQHSLMNEYVLNC